VATASAVRTERRDSDRHLEILMPDAPDPAMLEATYPAPGPWGERALVRPILGSPPHNQESTYSTYHAEHFAYPKDGRVDVGSSRTAPPSQSSGAPREAGRWAMIGAWIRVSPR
jgi:hypothetical protein